MQSALESFSVFDIAGENFGEVLVRNLFGMFHGIFRLFVLVTVVYAFFEGPNYPISLRVLLKPP